MTELRIFDYVGRSMERLGFLKRLLKRVSTTSTSSLENLGKDLISTVGQKFLIKINQERFDYINSRVRGNTLKSHKKELDLWLNNSAPPPEIYIEIQDLYLADPSIPSQGGRLISDNWRRYPALGTNLGLIRKGTYSINTRGTSFLHLIKPEELNAFTKYDPKNNPLRISKHQGLLLLYSLIENDGEVIIPLWNQIKSKEFTEKEAGDLLPNVYRTAIARHRTKLLPVEIRERLNVLEETARFVEKVTLSEKSYGGTSPRETAVRPRIEPYVDIGLFIKHDPLKFDYAFSRMGSTWIQAMQGHNNSQAVLEFLYNKFFMTAANAWEISAQTLNDPDQIISNLRSAWKVISSANGYAPIEEIALLAGIKTLINENKIMEIAIAREALIAYQKKDPYKVRFTVDRLGVLAHAKFMDESIKS